jgi:hypothetical protein
MLRVGYMRTVLCMDTHVIAHLPAVLLFNWRDACSYVLMQGHQSV